MRHRIIGAHIVIDHHAAGVHARTDTVVENQGYACINQFLVMVVILRVLGLRHDYPTALVTMEILADTHLALIFLTTQGHHDAKASFGCGLFDTRQDGRKIVMRELGHDDTNHP